MGYNLCVLAEEPIDAIMGYNREKEFQVGDVTVTGGRSLCLELRENFHDHVGDQRPTYTKNEFLIMSDHWIAARKKYDEMGQPEPMEQNAGLNQSYLPGRYMFDQRVAWEMTGNANTKEREHVHFHYNDFRLHMTEKDFHTTATLSVEARMRFCKEYSTEVSLRDEENVTVPRPTTNTYLPWLQEYMADESIERADPDQLWDMFLQYKQYTRPPDEQRYSNGWHPERNEHIPPKEFNKRYTYTVYESIKKHGYAKGPFQYDYMHALKRDGVVEIHCAHRSAALIALGYDTVPVIIVNHKNHRND